MGLLPTSIPTSLDQLNPFSNGVAGEENAPSLTIVELTGAQRALILKGRSLPHSPTSFGRGSLRSHKTTYPGNPQSTQQVLGPEEGDCSLEGTWKSRFIGGTVAQVGFSREVASAADMVEFVDAIRRAGQTVQVQWGPIVRVGLLVGFEPVWERIQDVRWTIDFEWQSQGEVTTKVKKPSFKKPSLLDKLNALSDELALGPEFLLPDINAMLVTAIAETREKVGRLFQALQQIARIGNIGRDVAGAVNTAAASLRNQLLEASNATAEVPVSQVSSSPDHATLVETELWRRRVSEMMMDLLDTVSLFEEDVEANVSPDPIAIVVTKQDQTLYQLSVQFYGTPDLAQFLAEVNFIDTAIVPAGTPIVVPPKPNTTET